MEKIAGYVEWIGKQTRKDLIQLLHSEVNKEQGELVKTARKKGEKIPRPNINKIVGAKIKLSEMGVVKLMAGEYATSDLTLKRIIEAAHEYNPEATRKLILQDLESHRARLSAAIENLRKNSST